MSAQDGKVPVLQCVAEAYRFTFANLRALLPACLAVALANAAAPLLGAYATTGLMLLLVMLMSGVANAVLLAAVLRRSLRPGDNGLPAFGNDEFRLLAAAIAIGLMFMPLGLIVAFVLTTILAGQLADSPDALATLLENPDQLQAALAQAMGPTGQLAFSAFILLITCIGLWLAARLFLINAAIIGEKRIVILQTWSWTRGNLLRVIAAMILTILPAMLVSSLFSSLVFSLIGDQQGASATTLAAMSGMQGLIGAVSNIPAIALGAELYRGLRPPDFVAK